MKRRAFLFLLGGASATWGRSAYTQQQQIPLVAFLSPRTMQPGFDPTIDAFRHGLRELGYVEGKNIQVELRAAGGDEERLRALAAELVALKPNVIVTHGDPAVRAVKDAAGDIPIVMSVIGDPIAVGFVQSLHHPGGNIAGLTNMSTGLLGKRLEMLLEAVPNASCVAVLEQIRQSMRLRGMKSEQRDRRFGPN